MKIVISRKGFDSQYGGIPSPIFPDGTVFPLPIPSRAGRPLRDLRHNDIAVHQLVCQLGGRLSPTSSVHLDPDLCAGTVERETGWRASLGQVAQAQKHLRNQGVGPGDIFLFFGWYRAIEFDRVSSSWRYERGASDIHSLFGWMQVQAMVDADDRQLVVRKPWLADHPHVQYRGSFSGENMIYVSAPRLSFSPRKLAGAGLFARWSSQLQLTDDSQPLKSVWSVPAWMAPSSGRSMSFHGSAKRWSVNGNRTQLRTVGKGQEFVLDVGDDPVPRRWIADLIEQHG
jgi:hypothetical protein